MLSVSHLLVILARLVPKTLVKYLRARIYIHSLATSEYTKQKPFWLGSFSQATALNPDKTSLATKNLTTGSLSKTGDLLSATSSLSITIKNK